MNLGLIVLAQLLLRFCIVEVYLQLSNVKPVLGYPDFALLVLATVLIAAGGYIINDIYDQEPDRVLAGRLMTRGTAWIYYWILNVIGILIGFYLSLGIDYFVLGFLFPIAAIMLYLYSSRYQKTVLTGNMMISLLSALVILGLWFFEFFALKSDFIRFVEAMKQISILQTIIFAYALFAFFVSLTREIVKDIEDHRPNETGGGRTLVLVHGLKKAKTVAMIFHLVTMSLLAVAMFLLYSERLMLVFWYLAVAVFTLFSYVFYQLVIAADKKDFRFLSNAYKLIMLAGILSMELFYITY